MERLLQTFREYPAIAGLTVFSLISVLLAFVLGTMMLRSGASLKPLIFFFGFLAIVGVPQATVHVLDALAHRRAVVAQADAKDTAGQPNSPAGSNLRPVAWEVVFGSEADPALITDAKRGLDVILSEATEAKLSFNVGGVQLDPQGKPTGELSQSYSFDLQKLKAPFIQAVTGAGWRWQPVMWTAPKPLRWLTE